MFQKFVCETNELVENLNADNFDACKSKIDDFIFKYAPDVSSIELYGAVASTWDDFNKDNGFLKNEADTVFEGGLSIPSVRQKDSNEGPKKSSKKLPPKPKLPRSYSRGRSGSIADIES